MQMQTLTANGRSWCLRLKTGGGELAGSGPVHCENSFVRGIMLQRAQGSRKMPHQANGKRCYDQATLVELELDPWLDGRGLAERIPSSSGGGALNVSLGFKSTGL